MFFCWFVSLQIKMCKSKDYVGICYALCSSRVSSFYLVQLFGMREFFKSM